MAEAPKRKKLEKTTDLVQLPASNQKFYCYRCGIAFSRLKGNFPVSHSPMYRGVGYLPICNDCVDKMYEEYTVSLGGGREAMRHLCMKFDLYWSDTIFDMVERSAGVHSKVRNYIGKTNIIRYIDKTFDDTIREEGEVWRKNSDPETEQNGAHDPDESVDPEDEIDDEIILFWGSGYTPDFYKDLERKYNDWTKGNKTLSPEERSLYKNVCLLEVIINRDAAAGRSIKDNVATLNSLLGSLNIKPSQKKEEVDSELENMPLGVGIQKWEEYRPLPATDEDKKDKNRWVKNITTWFLGHACKMVNLRNSYCKMYEDAMDEYRVSRPEYEDEDDDVILNDIFGGSTTGGD